MPYTLHPYQQDAVTAVLTQFAQPQATALLSLATGLGKTVVFSEIIRRHPGRRLVLAHRDELIDQAVLKLQAQLPPDTPIGRVIGPLNESEAPIVVASVQSLHPTRLRRTWAPGTFALIVIDEAHHVPSPSYQTLLAYLQAPHLLGVTATPYRADRLSLAPTFDHLTYQMGIREGIQAHWLTDLVAYRMHTTIDLDPVPAHHGDFALDALSRALDLPERNRLIVEATRTYAPQRQFLCFATDVAHAEHLAAAYSAAGLPTACLTGTTPPDRRRDLLQQFRAHTLQGITNCGVLTEGFDAPDVSAVILARPTQSLALFTQMVGRGTRTAPDKTECIVIDCADNTQRHQIISLHHLLGLTTPVPNGRSASQALDDEARKIPEAIPFLQALTLSMTVESVPDLIAEWVSTAPLPPHPWQTIAALRDAWYELDAPPPWLTPTPECPHPELPASIAQHTRLTTYGWPVTALPPSSGEAHWLIEQHLLHFAQWAQTRIAVWSALLMEPPARIQAQMFTEPWHYQLATDRQREMLHRLRVPDPPYPLTAGEASWVIQHMQALPTAPKRRRSRTQPRR